MEFLNNAGMLMPDHTYSPIVHQNYSAQLTLAASGAGSARWSGTATMTTIAYLAPIDYQESTAEVTLTVVVSCFPDGTQLWSLYQGGTLQKSWRNASCTGALENWAYPESVPEEMHSPVSASSGYYRVSVQNNSCVQQNGQCVENGG